MKNKKDTAGGPDSVQILGQAEQKARAIKLHALESMTWEEIRQTFHEMQVKQLAAELENEQLRARLEDYTDFFAGGDPPTIRFRCKALRNHLTFLKFLPKSLLFFRGLNHATQAVMLFIGKISDQQSLSKYRE